MDKAFQKQEEILIQDQQTPIKPRKQFKLKLLAVIKGWKVRRLLNKNNEIIEYARLIKQLQKSMESGILTPSD